MKDFITLAVPFMLGAIIFELFWERRKKRRSYRLGDAVASLGTGIIDQITIAALPLLAGAALYYWIWEHLSIWHLRENSPWAYLAAFVGADFCYYWWHRASHRMNFLWAAHVVHHQSEDFNLSTALRQNPITSITSIPFYLPLAVLGIPPIPFFAMKSLMILYQFWIHTEMISTLGPLELVLNTPSHHRVHHGIDPQYIDRNYAGAFIIWDRFFGSFEQESVPPTYGVLKPLRSFNPVWAIVQPWVGMAQAMRGLSIPDRIRLAIKPPGWTPEQPEGPDVEKLFYEVQRYDPSISRARGRIVLTLFFALLVASTVGLNKVFPHVATPGRVLIAGAMLVGLAVLGKLNM